MINGYLIHGLGVALSGITTPPPLSPRCSDWLSLSSLILGYCACLRFSCVRFFLTRASLCSQYKERTSAHTPVLVHALTKPLTGKYYRDLMECKLQIRDGIIILWKQNYRTLVFSDSWYFQHQQDFKNFSCKSLTLAACQQQVEHDLTNTVL